MGTMSQDKLRSALTRYQDSSDQNYNLYISFQYLFLNSLFQLYFVAPFLYAHYGPTFTFITYSLVKINQNYVDL